MLLGIYHDIYYVKRHRHILYSTQKTIQEIKILLNAHCKTNRIFDSELQIDNIICSGAFTFSSRLISYAESLSDTCLHSTISHSNARSGRYNSTFPCSFLNSASWLLTLKTIFLTPKIFLSVRADLIIVSQQEKRQGFYTLPPVCYTFIISS